MTLEFAPARMRKLSIVPRWSIVRTIQRQSVAEHTFHVCWLCLWLAERSAAVQDGKVDRAVLLARALRHDEDEATQGDMPSSAKDPVYKGDQYRVIIKMADCLEALLFLEEEKSLGNSGIDHVFHHVWDRYLKWGELFEKRYDDTVGSMFHAIRQEAVNNQQLLTERANGDA